MATTPLWVPLAVAVVAVLGTLAGVVFTQVWNSRLEERRWVRESDRLREAQAREDVNRTYEHRRAAYVDFLQEFERLQQIYWDSDRAPTDLDDPAFDGLSERWAAVHLYGTYEADMKASECVHQLKLLALHPENASLTDDVANASADYFLQIRKDLGVPEWKPAG
jgi:hypothetical protein